MILSIIYNLKKSIKQSILPVFTIKSYIICKIYYNSIIIEIFNEFIKTKVIPYYVNRNEPQSILIIDNILNYYNADLISIYYKIKVFLAYLLLYFPNFNLIKIFFLILKY